ncbi:MAG: leucine efflux protein LeuE [Firmicutes bacterium]|nr:leucine efflux protein LeuE [Bacillota bacterium]
MLGVIDLPTFVIGTIAIVLLPGPNSLYVLTTAARYGVRAGYKGAAGIFLGDSVLMLAAALGAASLLRAYPPLFMVVKYAGGAYLTWVGVSMAVGAIRRVRRRVTEAAPEPSEPGGRPAGLSEAASGSSGPEVPPAEPSPRPFRRAAIISLLNPKAILFFVSFWVQFLDPTYPYPALSFLLLAGIVQICSGAYLSVLIFSGTYLANQFRRRRRLAAGLTAGVGAIFVGFGVRLATASLG